MTIKLVGLVNGAPSEYDGKYVVDYDPTPRFDGIGRFIHLTLTEELDKARQFGDAGEAVDFYLRASESGPRDDGLPDRPLTAYNVEIG